VTIKIGDLDYTFERRAGSGGTTMKRAVFAVLLALALFCVTVAAAGRGAGEVVLFDAPKGAWLGALRDDASLVVLEEREGWRHVRLEGWIPVPAGARARTGEVTAPGNGQEAPETSAPPDGSGAVPSTARRAVVQGVLAPPLETGGPAGTGVLVLLVGESSDLDARHRKAGAECRARLEKQDRDLESLRAEANRALNSSDNFREAAGRSDQVRSRLARAQNERQDLVRDCRSRAQGAFEPSVLQRALSDGSGRFEFPGVPPGRYRVVAFEATGDRPRSWSFSFDVEGGRTKVLDPSADRSTVPADWGLR
jgi:hypothetical protein